jgi:hypothetical protein
MRRLFTALTLTLAVAACGSATSPTSPAAANDPGPSASTAAIHGTIAGGGTSAALFNTTNGAGAGMTVTVQGTNITTTVNGAGQFQLTSIPAGTTVLVFNGVGANAQLNLGTLLAGQTTTITVVINGTSAELEQKTVNGDTEIEGRIESITGTTLKVATHSVTVTPTTIIRHGDTTMTAAQLAAGQRVHVKGNTTGTGTAAMTTATTILVQNMNTSIPVNLQGTVSGLTGSAAAFEMTVDGRLVKGTSATEFKGGKSPSFSELANGDKVHVNGAQQNGFVAAEAVTLQGK